MAIGANALGRGEPDAPARPAASRAARAARRVRLDRWASRVVVVGGLAIIASIVAILFVIGAEIVPLFRVPRAVLVSSLPPAGAGPVAGDAVGVDEYRTFGYLVTASGVRFVPLGGGAAPDTVPVGMAPARLTAAVSVGRGQFVVGTSDGRVVPLEVAFDITFPGGTRTITPRAVFGQPEVVDPEGRRAVERLAAASGQAGVIVAQVGPATLVTLTVVERKALVGASTREVSRAPLAVQADGEVTALRMDGRGEHLFLGTSRGQLLRVDLRDGASPAVVVETVEATTNGSPVTVLRFLNGDRTLVVGDRGGGVSTWQVVAAPTGGSPRLVRIHEFAPMGGAVVAVSPSRRDKGFAVASVDGEVRVDYATSGQTLISGLRAEGGEVQAVTVAPKADGVLAVSGRGATWHWALDNPHPEVTLRTLFGPVWYEGYAQPDYVWQSTGGTDDFEAKLSLTPLLYGTLKGTFYALLLAVPLALLAALYVSEFMHPTFKSYLKPVVEIMAALPSVVLGFLAGLWLAPMIERVVPGMLLLPLVVPAGILGALLLWARTPRTVRGGVRPGGEVFLLVPVVLVSLWLAFVLGGLVERHLLGGDYRPWLLSVLGLTYDQRNSLVVGVAMGFAVVPIIFTIAEDSLANVPQHLRAGSLALGATRWQTALRIVLPTASPGIFSAIMIGFGRAVGETMIVLMATGNTPVMDWSVFSGFRALSANIAVELPEAPEGGTLFRVLFVAAFLLFCLTFAVNTVAEMVRLRLRRRYRYL